MWNWVQGDSSFYLLDTSCWSVEKERPDTDTDTDTDTIYRERAKMSMYARDTTLCSTTYNVPVNTWKYSASQALTAIVL